MALHNSGIGVWRHENSSYGLVVMSPSANLPRCVMPFWTHAHAFSLYCYTIERKVSNFPPVMCSIITWMACLSLADPYCFSPHQSRAQGAPDSKVHRAIMGPTWVLSAPDGLHVGPMDLAIRGSYPETSGVKPLNDGITITFPSSVNELEIITNYTRKMLGISSTPVNQWSNAPYRMHSWNHIAYKSSNRFIAMQIIS